MVLRTASSAEAQTFMLEQVSDTILSCFCFVNGRHKGRLSSKYYPGEFDTQPLSLVGKTELKFWRRHVKHSMMGARVLCLHVGSSLHSPFHEHFQIGMPRN